MYVLMCLELFGLRERTFYKNTRITVPLGAIFFFSNLRLFSSRYRVHNFYKNKRIFITFKKSEKLGKFLSPKCLGFLNLFSSMKSVRRLIYRP